MNNETTADQGFDEWCIVEVMGHRTFAGKVTEQEIGGASMLRLDVPEVDDQHPAFTKYFNASAIYALTPVTEELARRAVVGLHQEPIERYKLPAPPRDTHYPDPIEDGFDDDEYDPRVGEPEDDDYEDDDQRDDIDAEIAQQRMDDDEAQRPNEDNANHRLPGDVLRDEDIPF